jgi:hypothetical protein
MVATVTPNFALLEMSHPEIASLVAAMLQARDALNAGHGRTPKSPRAKNGGPTCSRTLVLASESGLLT